MPTVFGSGMVLQREKPIHVWGWAKPGAMATVRFANTQADAVCGDDGRFDVSLPAQEANASPQTMTVSVGDQTETLEDVLIGEVWVCSGQSNMQWPVNAAFDPDLEKLSAKYPNMRTITVPNVAAREPQRDFKGQWQAVTPENIGDFSAVGYFFGRQLHLTLDVPIGLIDNAWGGSAADAWVPPLTLEEAGTYGDLLEKWAERERTYDFEKLKADYQEKLDAWKDNGQKGNRPRGPRNLMTGNQRPGNLYYGVLSPIIGYTIRGVIWYQGESNASRAYQYRDLFPRMIGKWREDWGQGDFSFYWVQLADFRAEKEAPEDSDWAELRQAQTEANELPATGQAVIIDVGEGNDIHPRDKQTVAKRLARLALAKDYGMSIVADSPVMKSVSFEGNQAIVKFDRVGGGMDSFDTAEVTGFSLAGEDGTYHRATGKITAADTVAVTSPDVAEPKKLRYAWEDNPRVNLFNREGLPATPFRSDNTTWITEATTK